MKWNKKRKQLAGVVALGCACAAGLIVLQEQGQISTLQVADNARSEAAEQMQFTFENEVASNAENLEAPNVPAESDLPVDANIMPAEGDTQPATEAVEAMKNDLQELDEQPAAHDVQPAEEVLPKNENAEVAVEADLVLESNESSPETTSETVPEAVVDEVMDEAAPTEAPDTEVDSVAPQSAAPTEAPSTPHVAIQVASFADEANANRLVTKLQARGLPVYTESVKLQGGQSFKRVLSGPFADEQQAKAVLDELSTSLSLRGQVIDRS